MRVPYPVLFPTWNRQWFHRPFEPLQSVDVKMLLLKSTLLVMLASDERVSKIHALSVHPFVCYGEASRGKALSKDRLAHWAVEAIEMAYKSLDLEPPVGCRAHSTRCASSWTLHRGVSVSELGGVPFTRLSSSTC